MTSYIDAVLDGEKQAEEIRKTVRAEIKLRDQFAMAALPSTFEFLNGGSMTIRDAAVEAYRIADMMMEVRFLHLHDEE